MKNLLIILVFTSLSVFGQEPYAIIIHGGAGNGINRERFNEERAQPYHKALSAALQVGQEHLEAGASAEETVVQVIRYLEDSELFNAGRGAVLTAEGLPSLDASIMRGSDLAAGAVSGVDQVRSPIELSLAILEHSPHVMLSGEGAEAFAKEQELEMVDPSFFITEEIKLRYDAWLKRRNEEEMKKGTVGCVVRDAQGNIAAGTSTGGTMGKSYGRIGDSPIIGAGTYADNRTMGLSCTGHGEYFIRHAVGHDVHARMLYAGNSGQEAADAIIHGSLKPGAGDGGLVGITADGSWIVSFNTQGMFRAWLREGEAPHTALFKED